jgi:hypothetical protein
MPSIYQLLPRPRHGVFVDAGGAAVDVDLYDPDVWAANGWGLMAEDNDRYLQWMLPDLADAAARRGAAREYLGWVLARARAFHAALDHKAPLPPGTRVYLFAADAEATLARVRLTRQGERLVPTYRGSDLFVAGDLTVPRYSALADERFGRPFRPGLDSPVPWHQVTFLADDHVGLTANPQFVDNMLFVLLDDASALNGRAAREGD